LTLVKVPRRMDWRVMIPNQASIWLIQKDPLGVKWNRTCGLSASQATTSGVMWVERLSGTTWMSLPACGFTAFFRNARKCAPSRAGVHSPRTSPVPTFDAANRFVVPWRT
jgi:hypothetical protein